MQRSRARPKGASPPDDEGSPRYHVAPRGLLFFYSLLSIGKKPMTGYDLMREIEEKTGGAWRPGPGAVYPTLRRLARQGYVKARTRPEAGRTQVTYEITSEGLSNIALSKKAMESSGERMRMMSSLFVDLMEPDDLVRFATNSFEAQSGLVRSMTESERSGLKDEDRLFILRQYRLSLERELARSAESIAAIEGRPGHEARGARTARRARR